jgi:hypothetical protein
LSYLYRGDFLFKAFGFAVMIHNKATLALSAMLNSAVRRFGTRQKHLFLNILL